jgi:hypothetical protein
MLATRIDCQTNKSKEFPAQCERKNCVDILMICDNRTPKKSKFLNYSFQGINV